MREIKKLKVLIVNLKYFVAGWKFPLLERTFFPFPFVKYMGVKYNAKFSSLTKMTDS